jgi:hypothetical protein
MGIVADGNTGAEMARAFDQLAVNDAAETTKSANHTN